MVSFAIISLIIPNLNMAFTLHPIGLQQDSFLNSLLINVSQDMDELCEQESKHSYKGKY